MYVSQGLSIDKLLSLDQKTQQLSEVLFWFSEVNFFFIFDISLTVILEHFHANSIDLYAVKCQMYVCLWTYLNQIVWFSVA